MKREVGLGFVGATAEQLIAISLAQELTSTLLISLRDTLAFYLEAPGAEFESIILSGDGSKLSGLARALSLLVSIPIDQTHALSRTHPFLGIKSRSTPEQLESMTTAYGLALGRPYEFLVVKIFRDCTGGLSLVPICSLPRFAPPPGPDQHSARSVSWWLSSLWWSSARMASALRTTQAQAGLADSQARTVALAKEKAKCAEATTLEASVATATPARTYSVST